MKMALKKIADEVEEPEGEGEHAKKKGFQKQYMLYGKKETYDSLQSGNLRDWLQKMARSKMSERMRELEIIHNDKVMWLKMGKLLCNSKCVIANYPSGISVLGKIPNGHVFKQIEFWKAIIESMGREESERMDFFRADEGAWF
jgi:hypothetical protein